MVVVMATGLITHGAFGVVQGLEQKRGVAGPPINSGNLHILYIEGN